MSIDIRLLKPFLATASRSSFTKASEDLNISQPRLSLLIKKLEEQIGFPLFIRSPHSVRLTEQGKKFEVFAREFEDALKRFDRSVSNLRGDIRSRLRLGSPASATTRYPDRYLLLEEFSRLYPTARLKIESGLSNVLVDRLRLGKLDLTFAMSPFDTTDVAFLALESSKTFLAIPNEQPLAQHAQITIDDFYDLKTAVLPESIGPSYLLRSRTILREAGAKLVDAYEPNHGLLLHFAAHQRICAIVHKWHGQTSHLNDGYPDMVLRPIVGMDVSMHAHLLKMKGPQPPVVEWFWNLAKKFANSRALGEAPNFTPV